MSQGIAHRIEAGVLDDPNALEGLTIEQAARVIGKPRALAYGWLISHGYRCPNRIVQRIRSANDIEDEIKARPETPRPCWRCGGRVCGCGRRG